jgi:hypothetical protein
MDDGTRRIVRKLFERLESVNGNNGRLCAMSDNGKPSAMSGELTTIHRRLGEMTSALHFLADVCERYDPRPNGYCPSMRGLAVLVNGMARQTEDLYGRVGGLLKPPAIAPDPEDKTDPEDKAEPKARRSRRGLPVLPAAETHGYAIQR